MQKGTQCAADTDCQRCRIRDKLQQQAHQHRVGDNWLDLRRGLRWVVVVTAEQGSREDSRRGERVR